MGYVYPNNLMARRNQTRAALRGGILFAVIFIAIAGLFFASGVTTSEASTVELCADQTNRIMCETVLAQAFH